MAETVTTKKELIMGILTDMGYRPKIDDDGDVMIRYEMKNIYFFLPEDEEENFLTVSYPQFVEVPEGEIELTMAVCNNLTRGLKMGKVYLDHTMKNVTAACEFFYADDNALRHSIDCSLRVLSIVRPVFFQTREDLTRPQQ